MFLYNNVYAKRTRDRERECVKTEHFWFLVFLFYFKII